MFSAGLFHLGIMNTIGIVSSWALSIWTITDFKSKHTRIDQNKKSVEKP